MLPPRIQPWHLRGSIPVRPPPLDRTAFLARVASGLRATGCTIEPMPDSLHIAAGSPGQWTPLALVDTGDLRLLSDRPALAYDLRIRNLFLLCVTASAFMSLLGWFNSGDLWLTAWGFLAPYFLYGANAIVARVRADALLSRLCAQSRLAPNEPGR